MRPLLRRALFSICGVVALLVLFHGVEDWRGERAWAHWRQERVASGRGFDVTQFIPPPVPDADNFALVPRIADAIEGRRPLLVLPEGWPSEKVPGWNEGEAVDLKAYASAFPGGDIRKGLESYRDVLDAYVQATKKPASRIPIHYSRFPDIEIPSLLGFRATARMLQLRALVELRDGKPNSAFEDVSALLATMRHFEKEPVLLTQILRLAIASIVEQPIWEGLQAHAWSASQVATLESELKGIDLISSMHRSWEIDQVGMAALYYRVAQEHFWDWTYYPRGYFNAEKPSRLTSLVRHLLIPRGWILQNIVRSQQAVDESIIAALDPKDHRVHPHRQDQAIARLKGHLQGPFTFLLGDLLPAFSFQNVRTAWRQATLNETVTACELEQYRMKKGAYPSKLSDLGTSLPGDVIGGGPLHYRRTDDGGYLLYSVGWDGLDEGGVAGKGEDAIRQGDWVWRMTGKP